MRHLVLLAWILIVAASPAGAAASAQTFELGYVGGCRTTHPTASSTALTGCVERGTSSGALGDGDAVFGWSRVFVAHASATNPNTERGTLVFSSPKGKVTFAWEGVQLAGGTRSRGTWRAAGATGALVELAGRSGTYSAVWKRHGSEVSLVLRWSP